MAELEYEGVFTYVDGDGNTTKLYPEVKTDKTLSVPGKAADAASVSEAFADTVAWNYIEYPYYDGQYTFPIDSSNVTFTDDKGIIEANGTSTASGASGIWLFYDKLFEAGTWTLFGCPIGGDNGTTYRIRLGKDGSTNTFIGADIGEGFTFTLNEDTKLNATLQVFKGYAANNLVFKPMLVKGSHPRNLESSYQYLHRLLGPDATGGSGSGDSDANWIVKDGANLGNFHYTGDSTATPAITSGDILTLSATSTAAGVTSGMNFDTDLIDLTNYEKISYTHTTSLNGASANSYAAIQVVDSSGNVVYTNQYFTHSYGDGSVYNTETQEGTVIVSLANINGNHRIRISLSVYGQHVTQTVGISSCYLE